MHKTIAEDIDTNKITEAPPIFIGNDGATLDVMRAQLAPLREELAGRNKKENMQAMQSGVGQQHARKLIDRVKAARVGGGAESVLKVTTSPAYASVRMVEGIDEDCRIQNPDKVRAVLSAIDYLESEEGRKVLFPKPAEESKAAPVKDDKKEEAPAPKKDHKAAQKKADEAKTPPAPPSPPELAPEIQSGFALIKARFNGLLAKLDREEAERGTDAPLHPEPQTPHDTIRVLKTADDDGSQLSESLEETLKRGLIRLGHVRDGFSHDVTKLRNQGFIDDADLYITAKIRQNIEQLLNYDPAQLENAPERAKLLAALAVVNPRYEGGKPAYSARPSPVYTCYQEWSSPKNHVNSDMYGAFRYIGQAIVAADEKATMGRESTLRADSAALVHDLRLGILHKQKQQAGESLSVAG